MSGPRVVVVTYASDPRNDGLIKLGKTLAGWGWEFRPQIGDWRGFASKLNGTHKALPGLMAEGFTHVLFTDAYDSVCVGPPEEVLPFCTDKLLLSCEVACWPDPSLADQYDVEGWPRWKYVNSGGYLGPISLLDLILKDATGDDQLWMTRKYLECKVGPKTDGALIRDRCEVFQTLGHTLRDTIPWHTFYEKIDGGRVRTKETGTTPLFIHGNGLAIMDWLDDHLRLGVSAPIPEAKKPPVPEGEIDYNRIHGFGAHGAIAGSAERQLR